LGWLELTKVVWVDMPGLGQDSPDIKKYKLHISFFPNASSKAQRNYQLIGKEFYVV
jgi:hypothetical protein